MDAEIQLLESFTKIAEFAAALNVRSIGNLPGAWIHAIDSQWTIAVNGHDKTIQAEPEGMMQAKIPPHSAAIWFNGWMAGILDPFGGIIAAGEAANEDTFIAALDAAIKAIQT